MAASSWFDATSMGSTWNPELKEISSMTVWSVGSASAMNKPLFYYPQACPIEAPGRMQKLFLERSSEPWWLGQDLLQTIRDYFQLQDHDGRRSWVYRTQNGAWYKQGEFI